MRSSNNSQRVVTAFMAVVLFALLTETTLSESPNQHAARDSLQRVLSAETSSDLHKAVAHLVAKASRKQLQEYKTHSHNTIALHAAWEEVKRSTSFTRGQLLKLKNGNERDKMVKMDRGALLQFSGFVEGRLRVAPPAWWLVKLRRAKTYWKADNSLWFPRVHKWFFRGNRIAPYSKNKGEVHALMTLDLTPISGGALQVTLGKRSCKIPSQFLKEAKKEYGPTAGNFGPTTWMEDVGLTVWMDANRCIFGFHDGLATGFTLHCIDRRSSALIWSTELWGYFYGASGARFSHWVEMRRSDDTLCLFGIDATGILYIEGHSMKNGKNLFHFTTAYAPDIFGKTHGPRANKLNRRDCSSKIRLCGSTKP